MGMIIGFALFVGAFIGTIVSIVLCVLAIAKTKKVSHARLNVWSLFVTGFVIFLAVLIFAISCYPFASAMPGADYDIITKNFFLKGLFYGSSPGVAAILALFSTSLGRRKCKSDNRMKESIETLPDKQSLSLLPVMIMIYIMSPAVLMICMALISTYCFPLFFGPAHSLYFDGTDTKIESLLSVVWVAFISIRLRNQLSKYWFFAWWPILAVLCIVAFYVMGVLAGLPVGREERFPGIVVMLPTLALLVCISSGAIIYYTVTGIWIKLRNKLDLR